MSARTTPFVDELEMVYSAIIEVGAHRGQDVEEFRRRWPKAKVYAIEADPKNFSFLEAKYGQDDMVECIHAAVTDVRGPCEFYRYGEIKDDLTDDQSYNISGQGSILKSSEKMKRIFKTGDPTEVITVEGMILDDLPIDNGDWPVAMFMDIQGGEYSALMGADRLLSHCVSDIVFEYSHKGKELYNGETPIEGILPMLASYGLNVRARKSQLIGISGDAWVARDKLAPQDM